jgi:LacI family transcriptional regulator
MTTLKELAQLAGVSISTVSRSLHDHDRIPVETRERIKKLAREHHFEFNSAAQGLSTRRTQTIGVVYPDFDTELHRRLHLDLLVHDIRHSLESLGYDCLLFQARHPQTGKSNIERLVLQKRVDGFVFVISDMLASTWKVLEDHQVPLVQVHSRPIFRGAGLKTDQYDYFFTDNELGGKIAGGHLVNSGCRHPVCLADAVPGPEMLDRTRGFVEALQTRGIRPTEVEVLHCAADFDSAYRFVRTTLARGREFDGLFAHTDLMAIAAINALRDEGVSVPDQVRVVGFDDIPLATMVRPTLTTVHQPREDQARQACQRLVNLIEGEPTGEFVQIMLEPALRVRESC